jgi:alkanesulfonate monooxygenase
VADRPDRVRLMGAAEREPPTMNISIYSTCPQSKDVDRATYCRSVADVARWSEDAGCTGMLVYTDNSLVDPWLVSQLVVQNTRRLCPLVAVQPVYMHPYTAAKMVASIAFVHGRAVHLNMLAGGFKNDLIALGDETPHDDRYVRTTEYTRIMMGLLRGEAVTTDGRYYHVSNLRLTPSVPTELVPEVLMSGSSPAGLAAAQELGAVAIKYPRPPGEEELWVSTDPRSESFGVRIGVIARETAEEAWRVAHERFPTDRRGQITHKVAMKVSDSHWHRQLSERPEEHGPAIEDEPDPYWLGPFQNYSTFCPYLVGSYDTVSGLVAHYMAVGARTFVLDIPPSAEELQHIGIVFDLSKKRVMA